jgi:trk system potassium uptake protein TrkH
MFQTDALALLTIAGLVIVGGLGFTVLATAWLRASSPHGPVPLQVKLVLLVTAALLGAGTVGYAVVEWEASLAGLGPVDKLLNAFFQSTILRTAGFNSVDLTRMERGTLLMACVLMIIGASPGGTGGGIKTTTFAVLLGTLVSAVRGGAALVLFRRTIPVALVYRSAAVFLTTVTAGTVGLFLLLLTQEASFEHLLFEVCSALGTVGLSVGATAELDGPGKVIVAALMFAGRVGPLTLVLLLGRPPEGRVGYPDAKLMIG